MPAARADILELDDGRLIEGVVVQVDDQYHVQSRFGPTTVPAARVRTHVKARSVDEQVREHVASLAPDDAENRALLARWLVDLGREEEGRAMAAAVLELDPESAVAHEVLGHVRHQGVWRTPDEAKRAEGSRSTGIAGTRRRSGPTRGPAPASRPWSASASSNRRASRTT